MRLGKRDLLGWAAVLGLLAGCSTDQADSGGAAAGEEPVAEDLEVISEEQAAEDAAAAIDASNAEEAFERLKAEIEGDR